MSVRYDPLLVHVCVSQIVEVEACLNWPIQITAECIKLQNKAFLC